MPFFQVIPPGNGGRVSYVQQWPESAQRKPQHLTVHRARCCTPEIIYGFFKNVEVFKELGLLHLSYSDLV